MAKYGQRAPALFYAELGALLSGHLCQSVSGNWLPFLFAIGFGRFGYQSDSYHCSIWHFFDGGVKQHYDVSSRAADCPRRITRTGAVHGRLSSSSSWLPPLLQLHHLRFDCHVVATTSLDEGGECRRHQRMGCSSPCGNFSPAPMPVPGSPCDLESLPQHFVPTNTKVSSGFRCGVFFGLNHVCQGCRQILDSSGVGTMR